MPLRRARRTPAALALALACVAAVLTSPAAAQVEVAGPIEADMVWRAADGPYHVAAPVTIDVGATLIIEAGAVVELDAGAGLMVDGALRAEGAADAPVVLRGAAPGPDAWAGVVVGEGGELTLRHAELRDPTTGVHVDGVAAAELTLQDVHVVGAVEAGVHLAGLGGPYTVDRLRVDGAGAQPTVCGVRALDTELTLSGGRLRGAETGLCLRGASATLDRVIVADNAVGVDYGEQARADTLTLRRVTMYGNHTTAIRSRGASSRQAHLVIERSIFDANAALLTESDPRYPIAFDAFTENVYAGEVTFTAEHVLPADAETSLPYTALMQDPLGGDYQPTDRSPARAFDPADPTAVAGAVDFAGAETGAGLHGFWYTDRLFAGGSTVDVAGDVVVATGARLSFEPGVTVRFAPGVDVMRGGLDPERAELRVDGSLEADGTNARPVRFVSAGAAPAPGDWYGVVIAAGAEAYAVAQVEVGHAVRGVSLYESDHIVTSTRVHHTAEAGVYVEGGAPRIEGLIAEDNRGDGIRAEASELTVQGSTLRDNAGDGIHVINTVLVVLDSVVHDNADGVAGFTSLPFNGRIELDHCTVTRNAASGVALAAVEGIHHRLGLRLRSSVIADNGVTNLYSSREFTPPGFNCTQTWLWGSPELTIDVDARDCIAQDPLLADLDGGDFAPTHLSPLRGGGADGSHAGALPWSGALTERLLGHVWDALVLTRGGSPHHLVGDLVVTPGATLTIEPGAEIIVAEADALTGGLNAEAVEVWVQRGATVVMGTPIADQPVLGIAGEPVVFRSAAAAPAPNSWYGLRLDDASTSSLYNVELRHPRYGVDATGPSTAPLRYVKVLQHLGGGMRFLDVTRAPLVDVHGATLVGGGVGIDMDGSDGRVTSSFFTGQQYGIELHDDDRRWPEGEFVNNTFVDHSSAIRVDGEAVIYNTVAYDTSFYPLYDYNYDFDSDLRLSRATSTITGGPGSTQIVMPHSSTLRANPLIEDIDWAHPRRWWDGQVHPESQAIDSGAAARLPATDILGRPRVMGDEVDRGAFEFDPDANVEPRADPVTATIAAVTGEPLTFDGSAAFDPDGEIVAAWWTMSDGTVTVGRVVEHVFAETGAGQDGYITVVDDGGAVDHARVIVDVDTRPIADAGLDVFQDAGDAEEVIFDEFSHDPDGEIVAWHWDFGDGQESDLRTPRHSYLVPGVYVVTLTVTDDAGLTGTDTTLAVVYGDDDGLGPYIEPLPLADPLPAGAAVELRAVVRDPSDVASVIGWVRRAGEQIATPIVMSTLDGRLYTGAVPAGQVNAPAIEYWFTAQDLAEPVPNDASAPADAPASTLSAVVVDDLDGPQIAHAPPVAAQPAGAPFTVDATITDPSGVAQARVWYRFSPEAPFVPAEMAAVGGDGWRGAIPGFALTPAGVDYFITATDATPLAGRASAPAEAPDSVYRVRVVGGDATPPLIEHDPIVEAQPEGAPVVVRARITDADGRVADATLAWRRGDAADVVRTPMARGLDGGHSAVIPAEALTAAGVHYFIEARDRAGNAATHPAGAPAATHRFEVDIIDVTGPTIEHAPVADGQPIGVGVVIEAIVADPAGLADVRVYYRVPGVPIFQNVALADAGDAWRATLPAFAMQAGVVAYYLRAIDAEGNTTLSPAGAPADAYAFIVGEVDDEGPTLAHDPIADGQPVGVPIDVEVAAVDESGVVAVEVRYGPAGAEQATLDLTPDADDRWVGTLPGDAIVEGIIEYEVIATDGAEPPQQSRLPVDGRYAFTAVAPDVTPPQIDHTPEAGPIALGGPLVVVATVTDDGPIERVELAYAIDGGGYAIAEMASDGDAYTVVVPVIPAGAGAVAYVIEARDAAGNTATLPVAGEADPFVRAVEQPPVDDRAPAVEVALDGLAAPVAAGDALPVRVTATDDVGVVWVGVEVRTDAGDFDLDAAPTGPDTWAAQVEGADVTPPSVELVAVAMDAAGNTGRSAALVVEVEPAVEPDRDGPSVVVGALPAMVGVGEAVEVDAEVSDPSGVAAVRLRVQSAVTGGFVELPMQAEGAGRYRATVGGGLVVEPDVALVVEAVDALGNTATDPPEGDAAPYRVVVEAAPVPTPPSIVHAPVDEAPVDTPIAIEAQVTDVDGVAEVTLSHREAGAVEWSDVALDAEGGAWRGEIPASEAAAVEYYLTAVDVMGDSASAPADAPAAWYTVALVDAPVGLDMGPDDIDMGPDDIDLGPDEPDVGADELDVAIAPDDMEPAALDVGPGDVDASDPAADDAPSGCLTARGGGAPTPWVLLALLAPVALARRRRRRVR